MLLATAGILSLIGAGSPSGNGVQTLYRSTTGPITAFAQDGPLLTWFTPGTRRCNRVHVLSLGGVEEALPKVATSNVTCRWDMEGPAPRIAVAAASGSALWTLHQQATTEFDYVIGASVEQPAERRFSQVAHSTAGAGVWLGGVAGAGATLVYSVTDVAYVDQLSCLAGGSCRQRVSGGAIHRIVGRRNLVVPGTGPALQIATAAGRIADVPAAAVGSDGAPLPSSRLAIQVRRAKGGTLVSRVDPDGTPLALALSPHVVAVLARAGSATGISWYDALTGVRLGSVHVSSHAAPHLTTSDSFAIYRVGRVVHAIDLASGTASKLVQTRTTPIGLSLDGNRLAWAENVHRQGRILALFLGTHP